MILSCCRGREIVTLRDAGDHTTSLPKAEQDLEEWQAAVEALLLVVELNGPTMMARIGVLTALNRHVVRVFNPDRKDTLGKRKLKRDAACTRLKATNSSTDQGNSADIDLGS
jgi:hypothetical protein